MGYKTHSASARERERERTERDRNKKSLSRPAAHYSLSVVDIADATTLIPRQQNRCCCVANRTEQNRKRRRIRTRAKAKGKGLNPLKRLFGAASGKGTVRARVAERERNLTGAPEIELPLGEVAGDIQGEGEGGVLKEGEHPLLNWNLEDKIVE